MLNFFKNFFRHEDQNVFQPAPVPPPAAPGKTPGTSFQARNVRPQAPMAPRPTAPAGTNGDSVQVSLASILVGLPVELKARVVNTNVGNSTIPISLNEVLPQLASGSVKVSFGEIRMAVPQLFSPAADADHVLVSLPLAEILTQVNPSLLVRRQQHKAADVPEEIHSPFGDIANGSAVIAPKTDTTHAPRAVTPAPAAPVKPAMPAKPITPATPIPNPTFVPKNAPVAPAAPAKTPTSHTPNPNAVPFQQFVPKPNSNTSMTRKPVQPVQAHLQSAPPAAPIQPPQPLPMRNTITAAPAPQPPVAAPVEPATPIPVSSALRGLTASLGVPTAQPAQPAQPVRPHAPAPAAPVAMPAAAAPAAPAHDGPALNAPLSVLCEGWAEALRQEIAQLGLGDLIVALPVSAIQDSMKRGKVVFSWKVIRSWIRPALAPSVSMHDSTLLELPLKVITPLFVEHLKAPRGQQKVAIDENIPNLFFGFPQTEPAHEPAPTAPAPATPVATAIPPTTASRPGTEFVPNARSAETNYYVWGDTSDSAHVDETEFKRAPSVETNFLSRYATPNEVVARAISLPGVVGALVALPDGLMVSSKLPADVNGDTLAAFLPQIFGKVAQCTRELRMGELNNLNFTVGNVPWKIFRVNAIFFAAFGKAGHGLPTADLAGLAAQLDRKKPQ